MDGMNEKAKEISAEVMRHMHEIKALLEANGGVQYISMCIHNHGSIEFHNAHRIEGADCKGLVIDGYERGDNGND